MSDEPFGRQPQPVTVTFEGDPQDVATYLDRFIRTIERGSYDSVTRLGLTQVRIHPRAVND